MCSVLVDKIQAVEGKEIVRLHQATSDAQKIYADLVEHYTTSTAAVLDASKILLFLTNHKLENCVVVGDQYTVHCLLD